MEAIVVKTYQENIALETNERGSKALGQKGVQTVGGIGIGRHSSRHAVLMVEKHEGTKQSRDTFKLHRK
jgi:hypothetical protein